MFFLKSGSIPYFFSQVCWLHVVTTFPDVDPGEYTCSLVLKVRPATLEVEYPDQ